MAGMDPSAKPESSRSFPFPFKPYRVQQQLMTEIFEVLKRADKRDDEKAEIGVFESPTGTGKSLSILCSTLHWLLDHYPVERINKRKEDIKEAGTNWISRHFKSSKLEEDQRLEAEKDVCLEKMRDRVREFRTKGVEIKSPKRKRRRVPKKSDENSFLVDIRTEDIDGTPKSDIVDEARNENEENQDSAALDRIVETPKIIYSSRTHSQLIQFSRELRKTKFAGRTRCISLGSRRNLCINDAVTRLRTIDRMNDKCIDMKSGPIDSRCPYLSSSKQSAFRDMSMVECHDIEELHKLGTEVGACPYYGTRRAIDLAHVVMLPYQSLLNKDSRESLGLSIKNNIVIIDEAHNLIETLNDVYSVGVSIKQVQQAYCQLSNYHSRYKERLRFSNEKMIRQLLFVLQKLQQYLSKGKGTKESTMTIKTVNEFLFETRLDNINLFELCDFISESGIVKKLNGFLDYIETENKPLGNGKATVETSGRSERQGERSLSVLGQVKSFLFSLTNADCDGRVFVEKKSTGDGKYSCVVKFAMLNPAANFQPFLEEARCVLLLGGTMKPFEHFSRQLFPSLETTKIHFFECGHVVPAENVRTLALSKGPTGQSLYLNFKSRLDPSKIDEIARVLINFCKLVPEGFVIFFPSFGYKEEVRRRWTQKGFVKMICKYKPLLWESRDVAPSEILHQYSNLVKESKTGAILACVVGGKLSEGINFSDGLARCVAVIGMPYPNSQDPYIKEKVSWIDAAFEKKEEQKNPQNVGSVVCDKRAPSVRSPGMQYYENLCMRAVNQSIGRSIRHKGDYACILLIDQRYALPRISKQLPGWIQKSVVPTKSFGETFKSLRAFFGGISSRK